jgi:Putative prokaryotic signal transducing protein
MAKIDPNKESHRLAALYAGMEDTELAKIIEDASSLTEIAREVLRSELARRGMEPLPEITTEEDKNVREPIPPPPAMLRRFRDLPEASIAKSILDSAGIESYLADDNLVRMDWFYSNLIGGIKLFVQQQDVEEANNLLNQGVPEKFDVDTPGEYEQPRCPKCQSFEVSFDGLDKPASYAGMFINLPIPFTNTGWKCHACGHSWKEDVVPPPEQPR